MDQSLDSALGAKTLDEDILRAVHHAEFTIRRYIWGGFRPSAVKREERLMVAGLCAEDFVNIALERLIKGQRRYDSERTLLENLNSATDSIIWSAKKSSDREPTVDYALELDDSGEPTDPISQSKEVSISVDAEIIREEILNEQKKLFENLVNSFDGNLEVQKYLKALSEEVYDPAGISERTGIPIQKIYEIRRNLKNLIPSFFGVQNFKELERKLSENS